MHPTPTARHPGRVSVSTMGSNYETRLAVFTGECGTLEEEHCDAGTLTRDEARISVPVVAGQTYYFLATSALGAGAGTLVFNVEPSR